MVRVSFPRIGVSLLLTVVVLAVLSDPVQAGPAAQDDPQAQAGALLNEGYDLYYLADYEGALEKFEASLALYRQIGDRSGEGSALIAIGMCYESLGQYDQTLDCYQQALIAFREIGDRAMEALTLDSIGKIYDGLGQYEQALAYYRQELFIVQDLGDRAGEAYALENIGAACIELAQYEEALDYLEQALALEQEMGDRAREATVLMNIGRVYETQMSYDPAWYYYGEAAAIAQEIGDQALEARAREAEASALVMDGEQLLGWAPISAMMRFLRALPWYQEAGDRAGEALCCYGIGRGSIAMGEYSMAISAFDDARAACHEMGDRKGEADALQGMGIAHQAMAQYEQAVTWFQQALLIYREIGDVVGERSTLNDIAWTYTNLGQCEQALDYYERALALAREMGDQASEGEILLNMGVAWVELRQYEKALDLYGQALAIARAEGDRRFEGMALANLGLAYAALGQYEQALDYYQQALAIMRDLGDLGLEAGTLTNIAEVYGKLGQHQQALDLFEQALTVYRDIGNPEGLGAVLRGIGQLYEDQGDAVQAISYYQQAIALSESIQSQIQTEELQTSYAAKQVSVYEHLISLLWKEDRLEEAFNYGERARARAFLDQLAGGRLDFRSGAAADLLSQEAYLRTDIAAQRGQLVSLRNRPRKEWDTEAIAAVEDELTTLESDYAALLTQIKLQSPEAASLVSVDVASLSDIQAALGADTTLVEYFVTEERTLVFIITQDTYETESLEVSRDELAETVTTFRDFASLDDPHPASLQQLHSWLIAPIEAHLRTSMVGIVPHGVLHYLPFAALTDGERYLGEEYVLFTLPSASALPFIQEKRKDGADSVLALGNPTIAEDLPVLQFAEGEVEAIAELYETEALVGAEATEGAVWSQASGAGILHLAAHGSYNPYNPLFSAVHLAEDEENDGRLEVHEVYGLDLTESTDLVVLSACQTQMGALSAGDEVVGLTRAFLYAGTPSVIASLWGVDDQATALLMERFYTHLRAGLGKGEALRQAQTDVRAEYPHPYYWSAFVLTGDAGEVTQAAGPTPTSTDAGKVPEEAISTPTPGGGGPCLGAALPVGLVMLVGLRRRRGYQVGKPSTADR